MHGETGRCSTDPDKIIFLLVFQVPHIVLRVGNYMHHTTVTFEHFPSSCWTSSSITIANPCAAIQYQSTSYLEVMTWLQHDAVRLHSSSDEACQRPQQRLEAYSKCPDLKDSLIRDRFLFQKRFLYPRSTTEWYLLAKFMMLMTHFFFDYFILFRICLHCGTRVSSVFGFVVLFLAPRCRMVTKSPSDTDTGKAVQALILCIIMYCKIQYGITLYCVLLPCYDNYLHVIAVLAPLDENTIISMLLTSRKRALRH